jgi:hypothetical protein
MNFFEVLLNPQKEELEAGDRVLICQAANVLQVGEFQLLQLAYSEWFGGDMPETLVGRLFTDYMLRDEVPPWARHYARLILLREDRGLLDYNDPAYHRYDHDYATTMPKGMKQFLAAAAVVTVTMVGAILAASSVQTQATSLLPPFFQRNELRPSPTIEAGDAAAVLAVAPQERSR